MKDKKTLSARVAVDTDEKVESLAEELGARKSDVLRRAIVEYLEGEDTSPSRSPSPLAFLGVVALAIAPTLLATGYTNVGGIAAGVGVGYALLWVTAYDTLVEERIADAHDKLADVGGVVGFFRYVIDDDTVEDPDTAVERAANLDTLAFGFLVGSLAVGGVAAVLLQFVAVDTIPTAGVKLLIVGFGGFLTLSGLFMGISALASVTVASAGVVGTSPDADADA